MAKWMWKYRDFEFYHGMQYMLRREERGNLVPAFFGIPRHRASVRFRKKVTLSRPEEIRVVCEGDFYLQLDRERQNHGTRFLIPEGEHTLLFCVGNPAGLCALWLEGETVQSDESWEVDGYDNDWSLAGTSPLCEDETKKPGDFSFPEERILPVSDVTNGGERILDFGRESLVHLVLTHVKGETKVFYGESLEETYSDRIVIRDSVTEDCQLPLRACRYLRFTGATDLSVEAYMPILPKPERAAFQGDERMEKIWQTSVYTLALCSRMFYLDGIKRDRWPWAGDAYITARMDAYCFADADIMRRTLLVLRGESEVRQPVNNILEYSFYWILMLGDYYTYTGDLDFVARNYDNAARLVEYYLEKRDGHGFVPPLPGVWLFIDWHDMDKRGDVCVVQMLLCRSLEVMAQLAKLCGKERDAARYCEIVRELRAKIDAAFWNETLGAYVSVLREGEECLEVRRHPNYFAVLFGFADETRIARIMDTVLHNSEVPPITTPFFKFFEYEVLCRCGFVAEALDEMRHYFGGMLDLGATSIWEDYDRRMKGEEHYAMYGEPFDKSLCHAWGAGSLYFVGRYLAGVDVEKAGWESFTVTPCLSAGDFSVAVPAGRGTVRVTLSNNILSVHSDVEGGRVMLGNTCHELRSGACFSETIRKSF